MNKIVMIGVVVAVATIAAWQLGVFGGQDAQPGAEDVARAAQLRPGDADLAAIYDRSCAACHATPDAQAPLTGHGPSWAPRFAARGADGLLASAKNGYGDGAMPAMGLCADCSDEQLHDLIVFMSDEVVQ